MLESTEIININIERELKATVSKLSPAENDLIMVKTDAPLSEQDHQRITDSFKKLSRNIKVIICDGTFDVSIPTDGQLRQLGLQKIT